MTTRLDFSRIAEQMLHDYDAHTPGTTFADGFRLSISDAYRLQAQVAHLRERRGEHLAGYIWGLPLHAGGLSRCREPGSEPGFAGLLVRVQLITL